MKFSFLLKCAAALLLVPLVAGADTRIKPDVIYGRKMGMALTLDVLTPDNPNRAGILFMASGGWESGWFDPKSLLKRPNPFGKLLYDGFTIFVVRHGSGPVFKVPDAVSDVRLAVRYVRANAKDFGIDPDRIGACGANAGGHLSLMLGTTGDDGNLQVEDPVAHASSRVGAVVSYGAPTDLTKFLNDKRFPATFFPPESIGSVSPVRHVTADDAPTLFVVGLQDQVVPPAQSKRLHGLLRDSLVPAEFIGFPAAGHEFKGEDDDNAAKAMVEWFNRFLIDENPAERIATTEKTQREAALPTISLIGEWRLLLSINGDSADYTLKIDRKDKVLSATLISPRSGEYPAESITYEDGKFKMRIRRKYSQQKNPFIYDYSGALSSESGLRGTVAATEEGGDRAGSGEFRAERK